MWIPNCASNSDGFAANAASGGTTFKFVPPGGIDTILLAGDSIHIGTRMQCITCMMEYGDKSLEELRLEDYVANRKFGGRLQSNPKLDTTSATNGSSANAASGGTIFKFVPRYAIDTSTAMITVSAEISVPADIRTTMQCITCMKEYQDKSLEELRLEDYAANRKYGPSGVGSANDAQKPLPGILSDENTQPGPTSATIEESARTCVVCLDEERTCVLCPCRHLCTCADCGNRLLSGGDSCPICRKRILSIFHVYQP